jgi:LysM repeat protein
LTSAELSKANTKIKNPNLIKPKEILIIPGKKIIINKASTETTKIKKEISEQEWENKIFTSLEQGTPLVTKLGVFNLKKKFTP